MRYYIFFIIIITTLASMALQQKNKQGLEGHIYYVSGNRMPSPDVKLPPPKGIATTLYIFELTNSRQVQSVNNSPFYSHIYTKLIKTIKSDKNGHFKVKLPAGDYSLFVKKDSLYYANLLMEDNINPVKVERGKFTEVKMLIDYAALY